MADPRLQRVGFAKLQGEGIELFMRKYEIVMGRVSKNSAVDLTLGESNTLSRQHASIRYNFDTKCFELVVLGKNGVQVDSVSGESHLYTPESPPTPLRSRDLLIMGDKKFYFLLPKVQGGRKRRRLEPSPAPGAAPPAPSTAPADAQHHAAAGPPSTSAAAAPPAAAPGGPAGLPAHDPGHLAGPGPGDGDDGLGGAGGTPAGGAAGEQSLGELLGGHGMEAGPGDDDDALIPGSVGLPYDNGYAWS